MGIKDYIKKKKEGFHKFQEKRYKAQQEKNKASDARLEADAKAAKEELVVLKKRESHREAIRKTEHYKSKHKAPSTLSKIGGGISSLQKKAGKFQGSGDMFGSSPGGDMFGGDMFGSSPKRKKKK